MRVVEALERRVSFADLQRMPDDGNRYELHDGELYVVPSPLLRHQIIIARLFEALLEYRRARGGEVFCAPLDLVLSDYDVVQPDLMYFGPEIAKGLRPDDYVRIPPDLASEVLSPSTAAVDRGRKRDLFARYGLREYWVVDPVEHRVEVSVLTAHGYEAPRVLEQGVLESPTLRDLAIDLGPIFEGL